MIIPNIWKNKMFQTTNQVIYYDNYALINHGYPWVNGRSDLIPKVEVLYHIVGHILWEYPLAHAWKISKKYTVGTSDQSVPIRHGHWDIKRWIFQKNICESNDIPTIYDKPWVSIGETPMTSHDFPRLAAPAHPSSCNALAHSTPRDVSTVLREMVSWAVRVF